MWELILVGSFGAIGAAMALATIAAWFQYRRTGYWPSQDPATEAPHSAVQTRASQLVLAARVPVGLLMAVAAWIRLAN